MKYNQTDKSRERNALGQTLRFGNKKVCCKSVKRSSHSSKKSEKENSSKSKLANSYLLHEMGTLKTAVTRTNSLKAQYDKLISDLFIKIDFDCSGFITSTKINYCKEIPEKIFYFLGGVFQRVKKMGGVTLKMFVSYCEQAYVQAKLDDLLVILEKGYGLKESTLAENEQTRKITFEKKEQQHSKGQILIGQLQNQAQTEKSIDKALKPMQKYSLKIKTDSSEKKETLFKSQSKVKLPAGQTLKRLDFSYRQTSHSEDQSISFQSEKVRQLTERLDRQLQASKQRLFTNRLIS